MNFFWNLWIFLDSFPDLRFLSIFLGSFQIFGDFIIIIFRLFSDF